MVLEEGEVQEVEELEEQHNLMELKLHVLYHELDEKNDQMHKLDVGNHHHHLHLHNNQEYYLDHNSLPLHYGQDLFYKQIFLEQTFDEALFHLVLILLVVSEIIIVNIITNVKYTKL